MAIFYNGKEYTNAKDFLADYKSDIMDIIKRTSMETHLNFLDKKISPFKDEITKVGGSFEIHIDGEDQTRTRLINVPEELSKRISDALGGK